ncbi:MAG: cyclic nucleotide-binding domain-containing protein [Rhodospirillaceae bacterium]|nr:cyclic nucleotide-binding domain-containing protein [Rhodospirillaceae bacterium]MBT3911491.1 cyclic nucleotide-binding domain-containing protein [Rhodospirillaceae bacterium]MBT5512474.1 cyclic nucleotide-binding domain-containing protein [Rhodospirillaceae bacterium]MBT6085394.1 cyclic nucleotide-binding domain-containing protein [Rhodospirillaceae bacterium]
MVRQNRPFSGIYVIVKGEVRVELDFEGANDCGAPVELARLRRGDIFGEVSFVDNEPTSASVIAGTDAEILVIDVDVIQSLLLGDPTFGRRFFHSIAITLARRLRETNPRVLLAEQARANDGEQLILDEAGD